MNAAHAPYRVVVEAGGIDEQGDEQGESADELKKGTDEVHQSSTDEEKENVQGETDENKENREADEKRGHDERRTENGGKVAPRTLTDQVVIVDVTDAVGVETEVARARTGVTVADPLWLHEDADVEDGEASGEKRPDDADDSRCPLERDIVFGWGRLLHPSASEQ